MPSVSECQNNLKVAQFLEAITLLVHAQIAIDEKAVEMWRQKPASCVPALFQEKEISVVEECPIKDVIGVDNIEHRKFAKKKLLDLASEMRLPLEFGTSEDYTVYSGLAQDIQTAAEEIDTASKEPLIQLPGITELIQDTALKMFEEFDNCMKGD